MQRIRALIVDDSITARRRFAAALAADPEFEIVGEAADGGRAVKLCESLRPDVIALDLLLPGLSGVEATREIMGRCPTPILVVSASEAHGEHVDALAAGAVDAFAKPDAEGNEDWDVRFRAALKLVSRVGVVTRRQRARGSEHPRSEIVAEEEGSAGPLLVALGASLGGPGAIAKILQTLPASFSLPIVAVVHVTSTLAPALEEWLDKQSRIRVAVARGGEAIPRPGRSPLVFLAPAEAHVVVRGGRLRLSHEPERHACRPSVDVLFESVAREYGARAIGCLLSGMGCDGAEGLLAMRRTGAVTLVQDEASCAVFGMPREAIQLGAASSVVPISEMGQQLAYLASGSELQRRSP
jgi:two-component system chemotaxis response regulator CheB